MKLDAMMVAMTMLHDWCKNDNLTGTCCSMAKRANIQ